MKKVPPSHHHFRLLCAVALLTGGLAQASTLNIAVVTGTASAPTGTANFTATDGPGKDSSATNLIVRNNDAITYAWNVGGNGTNTNITITSTLPVVNGKTYETWAGIPTQCNSTQSSLSADKQTLTCVIPGPVTNISQSILPIANVSSYAPNGVQLPPPTTTIKSTENPTELTADPVAGAAYTVTVSATPRYDLAKNLPPNIPNADGQVGNNTYTIRRVPGPDGTTLGTLVAFPIVISAMDSLQNATNDELKGLAPLQSPITFTDVLPVAGAVLYNNSGTWPKVLPGATSSCVPTNVASPGNMNTNPNGTCTASQSGQTVTVTISNLVTDNTLTSSTSAFVTQTSGGTVYNSRLNVFERLLLIWVPDSALPANASTIYKNTYTNFTATAADNTSTYSGTPNTQPSMVLNGGVSDPNGTVDDSSYFVLTPPSNANAYFSKTFNPAVQGSKGAAYTQSYTDGTTGQARVSIGNNGAADLNNFVICEKFDNTTFIVNPDASGNVVTGVPNGTGGTGILGTDYTVEYGTGGVNGVGTTWTHDALNHSSDQAGATCADNQSPVWYTSLSAVPSLAAITKVRVKLKYPLRGSVNSISGISNENILFGWKATGTPQIGPNAGTAYTNPIYMDNWATISADEFNGKNSAATTQDTAGHYWATSTAYTTPYNTSSGDEAWLVMAKTDIGLSIPSVVQPNGNTLTNVQTGTKVSAGSTVTYQMSPTLSLPNASTTNSYPVTVTNTLPVGMSYVLGSASQTPSSIVTNSDGTTTITWVIPGVVPNSSITPITFSAIISGTDTDGSSLLDTAGVSAPTDPIIKTKNTTLSVSNPPGVYVNKSVLTPYAAPKGTAQYQLAWYSIGSGTTGQPQIIDILPYVGDGRGSTNTSVGLANAPTTPTNDSSMVFYYTVAAPSSIKADPSDSSNALTAGQPISSGSTVWCVETSFGQPGCPTSLSSVTAVRGVSSLTQLTGGTTYSTIITIQTSATPKDGDLYTNAFTMRSTGLTYPASSQNVTAKVRLFSISGVVYIDSDQNGSKASSEAGLGGVTLTLSGYSFGADGQDNGSTGNDQAITATTTTDSSGNYTFTNLPPGRYTVTETQPAGYSTTKNAAGTAGGTVSGDTISNIVLSRDATSSQATGYLFGELTNFVKPKLLKWVDNCGANSNLSGCPTPHTAADAITTGNNSYPGDILRYTIILNNTNSLTLSNTIITDTIPSNTTFIGATGDLIAAGTGTPLASYTASPYVWNTCTASASAATCTLPSGMVAKDVQQVNLGWNTDSDLSTISNTDLVPANTQFRLTFWVQVK